MLKLTNFKLDLEEKLDSSAICRKLKLKPTELLEWKILREALDARRKDRLFWVYTLELKLKNEEKALAKNRNLSRVQPAEIIPLVPGLQRLRERPVIMGFGPAGIFAALLLAKEGYAPLVLEQGADLDTRVAQVEEFWQKGRLNPQSNVQFGEGGAGAFSDGKLTTLIKDPRCHWVLQELAAAGAPAEILYSSKPHIGTDNLRKVVKNLRQKIQNWGGQICFQKKITDINLTDSALTGIWINGRKFKAAEVLIAALGHSARDTFKMFYERGLKLEPKAFSVGLRLEHRQQTINLAQYQKFVGHSRLKAADYKLVYHSPSGRSAYTFCMCPGGQVVAAASESGHLVTNGMSYYARDGQNANSAVLVGVHPEDFASGHPLAGVEFQRHWQRQAFLVGGENYQAPAQLVGDFLAGRPSTRGGAVEATYSRGVRWGDFGRCLPHYVLETLREALPVWDQQLQGFADPQAVLTGVETRSSSPVRILRDSSGQASIRGIYPAGEGAG
ncbi:MAG: hypothetical protein MJ157_03455, partial [Clostridia bacterium]|nr:hypothetical protein [Clostridia bacterium]